MATRVSVSKTDTKRTLLWTRIRAAAATVAVACASPSAGVIKNKKQIRPKPYVAPPTGSLASTEAIASPVTPLAAAESTLYVPVPQEHVTSINNLLVNMDNRLGVGASIVGSQEGTQVTTELPEDSEHEDRIKVAFIEAIQNELEDQVDEDQD
ncbi:hypothetical protein BGZ54_005832 [Gamsiella multidivaricata]|nr:hypothetical protein BGZ54_005832 [Gamsiella multidivaricata]